MVPHCILGDVPFLLCTPPPHPCHPKDDWNLNPQFLVGTHWKKKSEGLVFLSVPLKKCARVKTCARGPNFVGFFKVLLKRKITLAILHWKHFINLRLTLIVNKNAYFPSEVVVIGAKSKVGKCVKKRNIEPVKIFSGGPREWRHMVDIKLAEVSFVSFKFTVNIDCNCLYHSSRKNV